MRRGLLLAGLVADACVLAVVVRLWAQVPPVPVELRGLLALAGAAAVAGIAAGMGNAAARSSAPWVSLTGLFAVAPLLAASTVPAQLRVLGPALTAVSVVPLLLARPARGRGDRVLVAVAAAGSGAVLVLRDPFREPTCTSFCGHNPWLVVAAPELVAVIQVLLGALLLLRSAVLLRDVRAEGRGEAPAHSGPTVVLLVVAACAAAGLIGRGSGVAGEHPAAVVGGQLVAVLLLQAAGAARTVRALRIRRHVRLLSADLASHARLGHVDDWLRQAVRDDSVRVLLPDDVPRPGMTATSVRRGGIPVATLEHSVAAAGRVQRAVTPLVALALDNDRVHAQAVAQLEELVASRRETVQSADAARRRLERDLHDGAQQRLLLLGMSLAAASERGSAADRTVCRQGVDAAAHALSELRDVANGVLPVVLDQLGLAEALRDLAGSADVPVELDLTGFSGARAPLDVERAAYLVAASLLAQAGRSGATRGWVQVCREDRRLTLLVGHDGESAEDSTAEQDRVGAVRGSWSQATTGQGACVTVVLPCE